MKEISNSTLAVLVVAAIVVSAFGTMLSLSKLNQVGGIAGITGALSTSTSAVGTANVTIDATSFINLTDGGISFPSQVSGQNNHSASINDWFVLRNDGTVNISIQVYGTQSGTIVGTQNGTGPFTSVTNNSGCLLPAGQTSTCFSVKCLNYSSVNSSSTFVECNNTYYPLLNTADGRFYLKNLGFVDGNDTAYFGVNITVPTAEPTGTKVQTITFAASQT